MSLSSPCIGVCEIDRQSGLCVGCRRTLAEIAAWGAMDERQRRSIMAGLDRRPVAGPGR